MDTHAGGAVDHAAQGAAVVGVQMDGVYGLQLKAQGVGDEGGLGRVHPVTAAPRR
jgi:hypothetical protein